MTNLFQLGEFVLNSGKTSRFKLECDSLTDGDWQALAKMVSLLVGTFSSVEGVPRGGLKLAAALEEHRWRDGPILLVDDVLTTGGSMERMRRERFHGMPTVGAVIFARGPCPNWIKAVFQMPECFWIKP